MLAEIFDDPFIDYLFDLVEQTRHMQDETFNYGVIKLIVRAKLNNSSLSLKLYQVSLNEQFMVASLSPDGQPLGTTPTATEISESKNRILRVLMRRLGSSKTFGENMIFMLNRARTSSDHSKPSGIDIPLRTDARRSLYATSHTKNPIRSFYHKRNFRILLYKRSLCSCGCVPSRTSRFGRGQRIGI
jgi:hypothetical protein